MTRQPHRRDVLRSLGAGLLCAAAGEPTPARGCVAGHAEGAQAGVRVLAGGGNAVDAAVAAALVASVVSPQMCGPGGYGGHLIIARPDGRVVAIDFNCTAPRAVRPDMFPLDDAGEVRGQVNKYGWLASGVPGTLAGLQLALDRHGTRTLRQVIQPAIEYARDGFPLSTNLAAAIRGAQPQLSRDSASARLLLPGGKPPRAGSRWRNPELAALLETLAQRNSVDSFYRGDIARRIAAEFRAHDGLVTEDDLAAYHAREVEPLALSWRGHSIRTAPLTAGGLTMLQALGVLAALHWETLDPDDPRTTHRRVEALRAVWHNRLRLLGDPAQVDVPVPRLLSPAYAQRLAARVERAVREGRPLPGASDGRTAGGTIHISTADTSGMLVALTLTQGEYFGARVTVAGLGLILGHGMSRFDPQPGRANSIGPGKRPLHNMCPTVVLHDGRPVLAVGGRGGRRIPNAVFDVLAAYVGRGAALADALAAPRLHTEGGLAITLEPRWETAHADYLRQVGYTVTRGASAVVDAAAFDPATGTTRAAGR
jgi:gamma-glutamyltranspeptidase/glutathione hydrolase